VNWTEFGAEVSVLPDYTFSATTNRLLIANFMPAVIPHLGIQLVTNAVVLSWPTNSVGFSLEQNTDFHPTNWSAATNKVLLAGTNNWVKVSPLAGHWFFRLVHP
jgi:hypothetical protein